MNINEWCDHLVKRLPGVVYCAVIKPVDNQLTTHASSQPPRPAADFAVIVAQALQAQKSLLSPADEGVDDLTEVIAIPVSSRGIEWVLVAGLDKLPGRHVQLLMEQLEMASGRVMSELVGNQLADLEQRNQSQVNALDSLADLLQADESKLAVHSLCNHLAAQTGATRVSYVRRNWRNKLRLEVASAVAKFDQKLELNQAVIALAGEGLSLGRSLHWNGAAAPGPSFSVLARLHGDRSIACIPLAQKDGTARSALVLQWNHPTEANQLQAWGPLWLLGEPVLEHARSAEAGVVVRSAKACKRGAKWLLGANHWVAKSIGIGALALSAWLLWGTSQWSVQADALAADPERISVTSPADGFIDGVLAVPGNQVAVGDLLVQLRDDELRLERLELLSQIARYKAEESVALRDRQRADAAIARAKVDEVQARLALVDMQLSRTLIRATSDGRVADGDLRQRIGSRVDYGEQLMTLSPTRNLEIELRVANRHADLVRIGAPATLRLRAAPGRPIALTITRFRPASESFDGALKFQAFARVETLPDDLLIEPGMEGVARLELGPTAPWRVWLLPAFESVAMLAWRWLP